MQTHLAGNLKWLSSEPQLLLPSTRLIVETATRMLAPGRSEHGRPLSMLAEEVVARSAAVQIETCWHLVEQRGDFQARRQAVAGFNAGSRYRKRGLALIPTKFGIAFTAFFLNQVWNSGPDQTLL